MAVQAGDARGLDVGDKGHGGRDRFGVWRRDSPDGLDAEVRGQEGTKDNLNFLKLKYS